MEFTTTIPDYAQIDTGDTRVDLFIGACASGHWIGHYWTSPTAFSNVRLWGN
jgi:hypothetical protein